MLMLLRLLREERVVEVLILVQGSVQYRPVSRTPLTSYWRATSGQIAHVLGLVGLARAMQEYLGWVTCITLKGLSGAKALCAKSPLWASTSTLTHLLLRWTGVLQGSPRNLLWFKGAGGGRLFTAISHGRICDVVGTSHTQEEGDLQCWRHLCLAALDCLYSVRSKKQ